MGVYSKFLYDEPPVYFQPRVAKALGVGEAILSQFLFYYSNTNNNIRDGRKWFYHSVESLHKKFPFYSIRHIRRIIQNLEDMGILMSGYFSINKRDRTKWYSVDLQKLDDIVHERTPKYEEEIIESKTANACGQNVLMDEDKMSYSHEDKMSQSYKNSCIEYKQNSFFSPELNSGGLESGVDSKTNSKKIKEILTERDVKCAEYLLSKIRLNKHDYKPNFSESEKNKWANEARLMFDRDKRTRQKVLEVIDWSQEDSFWKLQILSMSSLRKNFDKLEMKMNSEKNNSTKKTGPQTEVSGKLKEFIPEEHGIDFEIDYGKWMDKTNG